ncbi:phosphatase [Aureococcus anophagefferens]|nr:phosphatase [Aureococcus anophagefferens]
MMGGRLRPPLVLWSTPTAAGRGLYGPLYVGVDDLAEFHNTQAGAQDCDHIHDGLGFFTQHALSMRFEQSVQLVDSRAALPYWDFTIEEAALRDASGDVAVADLLRTELWADAFFGSAGLESLAGAPVADGLWGYAAVRGGAWNTTHNAFGLLRAPWNNNPIPFVTRSATQCGADSSRSQRWPSCETHLASLRNTSTFAAWAYDAMLAPHGPLHVLVGGTTGCDAEYDALKHLGVSNRDVESLKMLSFALTKNLYRLGLRACPEVRREERAARPRGGEDAADDGAAASAAADAASATPRRLDFLYKDASGRHDAASPCRCGCPARASRGAGNGTALADACLGYKVLPDPALRKTLREMAASADGLRRVASVVHVLCEADVLVGDQLESASPVDISFWPIHPTLERLYHWKVHMDVDTLLSEGLEKTVTNAQLLEAFDPKSNALPFVYDAFRWDHCEERGVFLGRDR